MQYTQVNGYDVMEQYECDWCKLYKTDNNVRQHLRELSLTNFPSERRNFLENIKNGRPLRYVQCSMEVSKTSVKMFPTFHFYSETILLPETILIHFSKKTLRKNDLCLNLRECLNRAISWRMEQSLHRSCSFMWIWDCFAEIFFGFCCTLKRVASTTLLSLP